jgi:dihydroorotate dehydrogenase (fumarate)
VIERLITTGIDSHGEALTYFPAQAAYAVNTSGYLDLLSRAVSAVDIPVIASLNGITDEGWISYARQIEEAGAAAIELNTTSSRLISTCQDATSSSAISTFLNP